MDERVPAKQGFGWTLSQRRVVVLVLAALLALLTFRYACNPLYVADPQPSVPVRAAELNDRIDPNVVDWPALAALPGIGEKRAKDIVAYRETATLDATHPYPFTQPSDLLRIKGIGASILEAIEPYLTFPPQTSQPATREASN